MKVNIGFIFLIFSFFISCKNEPKGPTIQDSVTKGEELIGLKDNLVTKLSTKGDSIITVVSNLDFPEKEEYHSRMIEIFDNAKKDLKNMNERFDLLNSNLQKAKKMAEEGKSLEEINAELPSPGMDMNYYEVFYNHKLSQIDGLLEEALAKVEIMKQRSQNQ